MRILIALMVWMLLSGDLFGQVKKSSTAASELDKAKAEVLAAYKGRGESTYNQAVARAVREQRPLVVFVGMPIQLVNGAVVHRHWQTYPQLQNGKVYVSWPTKDWLHPTSYIAQSANEEDIQAAISLLREEVTRPARRPFLKRLFSRPLSVNSSNGSNQLQYSSGQVSLVDADGTAAGPWPEDVDVPEGLVLYEPSKYTQSIFKDPSGSVIAKIPRSSLDPKWQVPGGMVGIKGWKSDLYKVAPTSPRDFRELIFVKNNLGTLQAEYGYKRIYPNTSGFHDVLSNLETGRIFEHREHKLIGGQRKFSVLFKDESQRPAGYIGLKVACASCHNEAGTGSYGAGLVPGGDGVLSDPFPDLEQ